MKKTRNRNYAAPVAIACLLFTIVCAPSFGATCNGLPATYMGTDGPDTFLGHLAPNSGMTHTMVNSKHAAIWSFELHGRGGSPERCVNKSRLFRVFPL